MEKLIPVAIVPHIRSQEQSVYEAEQYAYMLNQRTERDDKNRSFRSKFKAEVFPTIDGAQHFLMAYEGGGILLLFSAHFLSRARKLARDLQSRKIKVYVITEKPPNRPNGQPVVIPNLWPAGRIEILADLLP